MSPNPSPNISYFRCRRLNRRQVAAVIYTKVSNNKVVDIVGDRSDQLQLFLQNYVDSNVHIVL